MSKFRKRFAAALGIVTALIVAGTALPASADTGPDGFPILYAAAGAAAHHCEVLGGRDRLGNEAVICTDLWTSDNGDYYVRGAVEGFCQNAADVVVQCSNVVLTSELSSGNGKHIITKITSCGHLAGACPVGRWKVYTGWFKYTTNSGCASNPDSLNQVWNIAVPLETYIDLPGTDAHRSLGPSYSTGHYYICDYPSA